MTSRHAGRDGHLLGCQQCEGLFGCGSNMVVEGGFAAGLALSWHLVVAMGGDNFGACVVVAGLIFFAWWGVLF